MVDDGQVVGAVPAIHCSMERQGVGATDTVVCGARQPQSMGRAERGTGMEGKSAIMSHVAEDWLAEFHSHSKIT